MTMPPPARKRMLSQAEIDEGLEEIARACKKQSVLLVGGIALHFYGSDRLTGDIDVVSDADLPGFVVGKSLAFGGYSTQTSTGIPVDVIQRKDDYAMVYAEALFRGRTLAGSPLPVVSLEYAVVMKMAAGRAKDQADLDTILQMSVDRAAARRLVKRLLGAYATRDYDQAVLQSDWAHKQT